MKISRYVAAAMLFAATPGLSEVTAGGGFAAKGLAGCRTDLVYLNQLTGWQVRWPQDWAHLSEGSDEDVRAAIKDWSGASAELRADEAALSGDDNGRAPAVIAARVAEQVAALLDRLSHGAPPLRRGVEPELARSWNALFQTQITPSIRRYQAFLLNSYMPRASRNIGLSATPGGVQCFEKAVKTFSTLQLSASEIELIGMRLMASAESDLMKLYGVKPRSELPSLFSKLRNYRADGFDEAKLSEVSTAAIARAAASAPLMFSRTADAPLIVRPVPKQLEQSFTAAAYLGSHGPDDPAVFLINLSRPRDRRLTAEAIAFHEGLPGHHASAAMGYPDTRVGNAGYLEGWAVYAEQLADEYNLYSSALDRTGMLLRRLSAASRLVVEPGVHVRGWTREQAIRFMHERTALPEADIEVELDRLIAGPGQPSSYALGYDRMIGARRTAENELGPEFDIREFHHIVLSKGGRSLDEVTRDVQLWVAAKHLEKPTEPREK